MNIENLRLLAARLRAPATKGHFNMSNFIDGHTPNQPLAKTIHNCGTVACIGGYAAILAEPQNRDHDGLGQIAREWLGLTVGQAQNLFAPDSGSIIWGAITPEIAADVVDQLADTGEVIWPSQVFV